MAGDFLVLSCEGVKVCDCVAEGEHDPLDERQEGEDNERPVDEVPKVLEVAHGRARGVIDAVDLAELVEEVADHAKVKDGFEDHAERLPLAVAPAPEQVHLGGHDRVLWDEQAGPGKLEVEVDNPVAAQRGTEWGSEWGNGGWGMGG